MESRSWVAQVAIQMGRHAAPGVLRGSSSNRTRPFITGPGHGDHWPCVGIGRFRMDRLHGYLGWLAWLFVHILNLIGFPNQLVVMVQWAWSYFSYQRASASSRDRCRKIGR